MFTLVMTVVYFLGVAKEVKDYMELSGGHKPTPVEIAEAFAWPFWAVLDAVYVIKNWNNEV